MKGAQILVECLKREGVDVVFGIPGGANLPTFDALYKSDIRVILTVHEQGAAHMADGYARATGKVGVCVATSGPGATNLVTGIANAYMDSIPIVALTGQVRTSVIGNDAFQEADTVGVTRPVTKHSYLVKDVRDMARAVREAFYIARTGRPGPVLIDLPVDSTVNETEFVYPEQVNIRGYRVQAAPPIQTAQVQAAAEAIKRSTKPVIYVGAGVIHSGAAAELMQLARTLRAPVTTSLLGLGSFPETDPLSLGMLGMHGFEYTNLAVAECDVLIGIGARFDDRVTGKPDEFAKKAKKIHIDVDPSSINKTVVVDYPIVGDVKDVLCLLLSMVKPLDTDAWLKRLQTMKEQAPLTYREKDRILPQYIIQQVSEATKGNAIIATGVGQHQMWTAQYYQFNRPRTLVTSGGLGTMGFGLPAAIGAQFGCPKDTVWDIDGDGSFMMTAQELATAAKHRLPVKVAIMNNQFHGMVRQWQDQFYEGRYASSELNPVNFVKLAEAYGCVGIRVERKADVRPAIEQAQSVKDRPTVIDFLVEQKEDCWPMIAPGKPHFQMLGTYEMLSKDGGVAQRRRATPDEESKLSLG
ncbi:MAG: acetolactate synthase, large subunit, biosynthetic type [Candidatus Omnitrophica bacterium CG11_big_fil_rev_8_21_14_0_20_63_9]|nr:MAG: acetolactate synthase, large subunit, biosynthetic type [Candidatus Omnitrophica bacterium CG11_big_fil_rev_8_21_14_0_20_63_9]